MAKLRTIFVREAPEDEQDDKLVDLFRNRVELKKAFATLRDEKYDLQERVRYHQGATARVEQQMAHLESLLLDPAWVHNVTAFYQLRRLAMHCQKKLERFAEELKQQREKRAHGKTLDSWNTEREGEVDRINAALGEQRVAVQILEDQLQSARQRLESMNSVSRMLQGAALERELETVEAKIESGQRDERALLEQLEELDKRPPPDHEGLDIRTKRSINFMILAFAQQLYLHYEDDELSELAKEASEKSVGAVNYGGKKACDEIFARLAKRKAEVESATGFTDALQMRARLIAERAAFGHKDDAVPVAASVSTVFDIDASGDVTTKEVNLLGGNYFGVSKVLSR